MVRRAYGLGSGNQEERYVRWFWKLSVVSVVNYSLGWLAGGFWGRLGGVVMVPMVCISGRRVGPCEGANSVVAPGGELGGVSSGWCGWDGGG